MATYFKSYISGTIIDLDEFCAISPCVTNGYFAIRFTFRQVREDMMYRYRRDADRDKDMERISHLLSGQSEHTK
jgi:hypothetical protein